MAYEANKVLDKSKADRMVENIEKIIDSDISRHMIVYNCIGGANGDIYTKDLYSFLGGWSTDSPQGDDEKLFREVSSRLRTLYERAGWKVEIRESKKRALIVTGVWEYTHAIVIRKS